MAEFKKYNAKGKEGQNLEITIASGPVIIENEKVLLVKHGKDDFWKFPGGKVNDNNSFSQNAIREANEELGIEVVLSGEPFVLAFTKDNEYVILIHYLAQRSGDISPASDIKEWQWFDVNDLPNDCAPNIAAAVQHFTNP